MSTQIITDYDQAVEVTAEIPDTLQGVIEPQWLGRALRSLSNGSPIATVELAQVVQAMAAKVRIAVTFANEPQQQYGLCIKGFLDHDLEAGAGGLTTLREADFYLKIAPLLSMQTPPCPVVVTDRNKQQCVFIMSDMIAAGAHFYNALEPLTVDQVAETLDQLARLHAASALLKDNPWIPCRIQELAATGGYLSVDKMQSLMHDERRGDLPADTLDAQRLMHSIVALAEWNAGVPQSMLHGDCHPGNVYRRADGTLGFTDWQLIQHGHWALDVAYHIVSVLPVATAEQEERRLLEHYLQALQSHGGDRLNAEQAWEDYRRAQVYGFYQWAITQRVDPPITHQAFRRLGAAVTRHDSYRLLGI